MLGHYTSHSSMYDTPHTMNRSEQSAAHARFDMNFAPSSFRRAGISYLKVFGGLARGLYGLLTGVQVADVNISESQKQGYAYPVTIDAANVIASLSQLVYHGIGWPDGLGREPCACRDRRTSVSRGPGNVLERDRQRPNNLCLYHDHLIPLHILSPFLQRCR